MAGLHGTSEVATVKIREKGRKLVGQPVRGDLEEHSLWNAGVKQAYAFMQDRDISAPRMLSFPNICHCG